MKSCDRLRNIEGCLYAASFCLVFPTHWLPLFLWSQNDFLPWVHGN